MKSSNLDHVFDSHAFHHLYTMAIDQNEVHFLCWQVHLPHLHRRHHDVFDGLCHCQNRNTKFKVFHFNRMQLKIKFVILRTYCVVVDAGVFFCFPDFFAAPDSVVMKCVNISACFSR